MGNGVLLLFFIQNRHLETWFEYVEANGLDKNCMAPQVDEEEAREKKRRKKKGKDKEEEEEPEDESELEFLAIPLAEGDTDCLDYSFSGKMSEDGLPEGKGTLRFKRTKMGRGGKKRCLKRGKLFGSDIEQVKGVFR